MNMNSKPWACVQIQITAMEKNVNENEMVRLNRYDESAVKPKISRWQLFNIIDYLLFSPVSGCRRGPSRLVCPGTHNTVKRALVE